MDILNWVYLLKNKLVKTTVQDPTQDLVILGNNVSYAKRGDKYQSYGMTVEDFAAAVSGLQGESYILVKGDNPDPAVNGAELKAAYDVALASTPYGNPRGLGNEFSVIIGPGTYDMRAYNTTFGWELTGDYINMISLTGESDVVISTFCVGSDYGTYKGLNTKDAVAMGLGTVANQILLGTTGNYSINASFENCIAGDYSFGAGLTSLRGSFKNCQAGLASFGSVITTFIPPNLIAPPQDPNVVAGSAPLTIIAKFENCRASINSFGSVSSSTATSVQIVTSIFKNCEASSYSFGYATKDCVIFETTFTDCSTINGNYSFGASTNLNNVSMVLINSGTIFTNCKTRGFGMLPGQSFGFIGGNPGSGAVDLSCTFTNCEAGSQSFGWTLGNASLSGNFTNCEADDESFGFNPFTLTSTNTTGTFTNCIAGQRCFGAVASGIFTNCTSGKPGLAGGVAFGVSMDGSSQDAAGTFVSCISTGRNAFGSTFSGTPNASGSFYSCVANGDSFANMDLPATSNLTGKALYCHKTAGSFYASPGGAKAILCINSALTVQTI